MRSTINSVNQPAQGRGSSPEGIQQKTAAAGKSSSSASWSGKREWDQRAAGHYLFVPLQQWWASLVGSGNNSNDQDKRNEEKLQTHQQLSPHVGLCVQLLSQMWDALTM